MKTLFVYENMYIMGGIQTWLLRVLPMLRSEGHDVALLTRPATEAWDDTSAFVDRLAEHVPVHVAGRHWFSDPRSVAPALEGADVLFACNLETLLRASFLQRDLLPAAKVVAGVFHAREYCWRTPPLRRRWRQHLSERLLGVLPVENFMFCTEMMGTQTGQFIGRDLGDSPVLPFPIDTERLRPRAAGRADRHKIVSVTRLVPYYTHHRQMIGVIRELRAQGEPYTYHAYGDGEEREALEREVRRQGLDGAVFFHGTLPYERFAEAVGDAFAYIGLGTALVEAAACGVPSLAGIDMHPGPSTYGYLHETVREAVGGYVPGHPEYDIAERLRWLANMPPDEYRQAEQASRRYAEEFGMESLMPRLASILEGAAPFSLPVSARDRALGRIDWMLEAALLRLGARDTAAERFVRRPAVDAVSPGAGKQEHPPRSGAAPRRG
jgi:glycosyltransferase involved in cell wall biosynthesis